MNYREVKASERLPKMIGYYNNTTIENKMGVAYWDGNKWWDDPYQDEYVKLGIKPEFIKSWLEPFEISEDDLVHELLDHMEMNQNEIELFSAYSECQAYSERVKGAAKAILKQLLT